VTQTVELGSLVAGGAPIIYGILMPGEHVPGGIPVVKVRNFEDGRLDLASMLRTTPEIDAAYRRSRLRAGDILLSIRGTTGRVAVVPDDLEGGNITQDSARIRIEDCSLRDYVAHVLTSPFVQKQVALHTVGQAVKGINIASVRKLRIPLPVVGRRHLLTRLFDTFKASEHVLADVVAAKRRLKRALLQQLLSGSMRFAHASGAWKRTALGDLTSELSTRNRGGLGAERVMGVLKHEGLVPMRERTMAEDLSRYKVVPPGAFAYNPMRINIGSIAYSWHKHDVLVSPDYEVFATRPDSLDPRYLDHLRRSEPWANFVKRAGNGSVRVRIYYQDLGQFVFPLPPLDEQRRIATLLDKADDEISLLERQFAAYRQLKRGLMQQLLTGEIGFHSGIDVLSSTADDSVESGLRHE